MKDRWEHLVGALGLVLLAVGTWYGLVGSPSDREMREVSRIMYVHVPAAWASLLCFTFVFGCAVAWLVKGTWLWDGLMEAGIEVGLVLGVLLIALGSIWAKPTWGVWWDWDPRLTSAAVLILAFSAVLALRGFVDDPERRATWSAVASIIAYVDVPVVYYSVRWWRTLHQEPSSPATVDALMVTPLRINAVAFVLIAVWFVARRYRIARRELARELEAA